MPLRCLTTALLGLAILLAAACTPRPAGEQSADESVRRELPRIAASMGQAHALTLDMTMIAKRPDEDRVIFTINAWITPERSLRVHITKLGYPFLSARIDPDGSIVAHQLLDKFAVRSDLDRLKAAALSIDEARRQHDGAADEREAAAGVDLFQELRLLIAEFTAGPIPLAENYRISTLHPGGYACDLADGNSAHFTLEPNRRDVSDKWIHDSAGELLAQIHYGRYKDMDGLHRPSKMGVVVSHHDGDYQVRLKRLDQVPAIAPDRMTVDIPETTEVLDETAFIERFIGTNNEQQEP